VTRFCFVALGSLVLSLVVGCSSDESAKAAAGSSGTGGSAGTSGAGGAEPGDSSGDATANDSGPVTADYSDPKLWLCLPSLATDLCRENQDATVLRADGTSEVERHVFAQNPAVDCFYVYPTVSTDQTANSDLTPDDPEKNVVREQAARLTRECSVYAPIYRQLTLASLFDPTKFTQPAEERRAIAYKDVLDAWHHYRSNLNQGRPFVLIGHSQGTGMLKRLIQEEIDGSAELRGKLVSALLIGGDLVVPQGADVGGDFKNIPLCRASSDTGCAVAYSSFRSTALPPANSFFGRPRAGTGVTACNNPAALAGGSALLTPYYRVGSVGVLNPPAVSTPYYTVPDFLRGECVVKDGFSFLEITVLGNPADPRADDINGDLTPEWGLHLVDVHLAMGDLVKLVGAQIASYVN
jgi:Protein of unknown function (DUF3089)